MPSFMGEKARRKPAKRANSHAVADSGEKIDLLKTIKMPRNLNQLNKGLLPKEKYVEEEIKADTMKSEQMTPGKLKKLEQGQERINYESDANANPNISYQE